MKSICMSNKTRSVGEGVKFERIRRITGLPCRHAGPF